MSPWPEKGR